MSSEEVEARNRQRYRYLKYLAEMRGLTIRNLHREFSAACRKDGAPEVHYSVFYRVCQGKRSSRRVRRWIAAFFKIKTGELWS